jgi:hypothetical protein
MAGRATTPQGCKLGNINNMPNRRYLPSINFSVPFARWSHFYVSIDWTNIKHKDEEIKKRWNIFFKRLFSGWTEMKMIMVFFGYLKTSLSFQIY